MITPPPADRTSHRRTSALPAWILLCAGLGLTPLAHAAGSATISTDENKTFQVEWLDPQTVRMGEQNANEYMVLRDGKAYMVQAEQGSVMEMGEMMRTLSQVAKGLNQPGLDISDRIPAIESVQNTGKPVTVAGIRGVSYNITIREPKQPPETLTAVLTDDATVTELSQAYLNTAAAMMTSTQAVQDIRQALPKDHQGILQVSGKYAVKTVSSKKPDPARFVLPSPPTDMNSMLQGIAKQLQKLN